MYICIILIIYETQPDVSHQDRKYCIFLRWDIPAGANKSKVYVLNQPHNKLVNTRQAIYV
jgi:hypothetical protein